MSLSWVSKFPGVGSKPPASPLGKPAHAADNSLTASTEPNSRPVRWIIILGIVLVGVTIAATGLTLLNLRDRELAESARELKSLTYVLSEQIDRNFQSMELIQAAVIERMRTLGIASAEDYKRQMSGRDTYQSLKDQISGLPHVDALVLLDTEGHRINVSRAWPTTSFKAPVGALDFLEAFKSDPFLNTFVGRPIRNPITGTWVINFAHRFTGPNGEYLGAVLGVLTVQSFERIISAIAPTPNSSITLARRDGMLLARWPRQETAVGQSVPYREMFANLLSKTNHASVRRHGVFDGKDRLFSVHSLAHYPIVVVATTPVANAVAHWQNEVISIVSTGAILALVVGGIVFLSARQIERRLRGQNLQFDAALSNMSQGLVMFDSAGRLVVCNQRYLGMYGLSPEVVRPGCTLRELLNHRIAVSSFCADDVEQYMTDIMAVVGQETNSNEITNLPDGRIIQVIIQPIADGGWLATHEDVTDKVNADDVIRKQKQQLNATLENVSQGVCMFDAAQRLIFCNKHYADLYGLTGEQTKPGTSLHSILQHRISNGSAPEDHEAYIKDRLSEVSINKLYQTINHLRDGRHVSVVHRPTADGGWVATHEDVTDAIRRKESFRLLFDGNPVPMWVLDRESLGFLAVNEAAIKHYGYSREQFMTMTALELRPAKDRQQFVHIMKTLPDDLVDNTSRHTKADGTAIDVLVYSRTLTYQGHSARLSAIHDITDRKRSEDELRRTQKFFDTVIEHVPIAIMVKDVPSSASDARDLRFSLINRAGEELFGIPRQQIIGKTTEELYPNERADYIAAHDAETLKSDQTLLSRDHSLVTPGNGTRLVTAKTVAIRNNEGKPQHLLIALDDVTERRRAEQRIEHMAHYDTLTDLPNRVTFNETLDVAINRAATTGEQFSILSIDLDHFKEANDAYGHMIGDGLLREVAHRLQAAAGEAFLARLGGDEFALIAADGTQPAAAAALAERLLDVFAYDFEVEGHSLRLGMSIGVSIYPTDGADAKTIMTNADVALYRAKAEMRGSAMFFEPEMGARLHERYALQEDLHSAIDRGELLLHYQPQVTMSGETIGFEALARWQCPKRGMVAPGTFIPIAEESSLIIPVGEWVLREACREAASWPQPLTIAVNISPIQFRYGELPRLVHSILLETGLAPGRLELEITESVVINDFSRAVAILNQLKSLGVRIAMDDFGTGYSSLSYLQSFRCDKIKIDRIFVCDLEQNHHSRSIVRAVIGLGRSLNLPILAEGVETEAQHAFLKQEGCDEVQGYLTGRPLPIADYTELIGRHVAAQNNYALVG